MYEKKVQRWKLLKVYKKRFLVDPDVYIYPESNYNIEWESFFNISNFPKNEKSKFKEKFIENFILSNRSAIAEMTSNKVDSFYQRILLQNKYPLYSLISEKKRRKFEMQLYNMTDGLVVDLDNFFK